MKISATDYLLQNIKEHLRKRYRSKFFCCCSSCGSLSWIDYEEELGELRTFLNELMKNGEMETPRRLVEYLVEKKKHNISLICSSCEKELEPILFCDVDKKMRIKVYKMNEKERKNFANGYNISEKLRRENDFKENGKKKNQ